MLEDLVAFASDNYTPESQSEASKTVHGLAVVPSLFPSGPSLDLVPCRPSGETVLVTLAVNSVHSFFVAAHHFQFPIKAIHAATFLYTEVR